MKFVYACAIGCVLVAACSGPPQAIFAIGGIDKDPANGTVTITTDAGDDFFVMQSSFKGSTPEEGRRSLELVQTWRIGQKLQICYIDWPTPYQTVFSVRLHNIDANTEAVAEAPNDEHKTEQHLAGKAQACSR